MKSRTWCRGCYVAQLQIPDLNKSCRVFCMQSLCSNKESNGPRGWVDHTRSFRMTEVSFKSVAVGTPGGAVYARDQQHCCPKGAVSASHPVPHSLDGPLPTNAAPFKSSGGRFFLGVLISTNIHLLLVLALKFSPASLLVTSLSCWSWLAHSFATTFLQYTNIRSFQHTW